jgi:hypothetical protein
MERQASGYKAYIYGSDVGRRDCRARALLQTGSAHQPLRKAPTLLLPGATVHTRRTGCYAWHVCRRTVAETD